MASTIYHSKKYIFWGFLYCLLILLQGCSTVSGTTPEQKRMTINNVRTKTLSQFYEKNNYLKQATKQSVGYAVFNNIDINLLIAAVSNGYGVLHDNRTNKDIYMKMAGGGIGLGAGAKDYRILLIFHTSAALDHFIKSGWSLGANADAAAKSDDKGAAASADSTFSNITTYTITKSGLALQATVKGVKYWIPKDLNAL